MPKYIDAEALKEVLFELKKGYRHIQEISAVNGCILEVMKFPTADVVEVKHGKWIEGKSLEKCSVCGKKGFPDWIYCPRCGAKMDGDAK